MSGSILDQIANPKGVNLLADYAGAAQAAQGIWGAREMQAKQAAGEAFRNSLNPDGTPNQLRLNQGLAADPRTSLVAQQSAQSGQTLDNETFDTHMKRLTGVNSAAMALTAQYPKGVPQQAVYDELDRVGPTMGLSPQQIAQAKTSFGDDPQANSMTIIRNGMQNLQAQAALHAARPGTGTVTAPGGGLVGYQTAPAASLNPGAVSVPPQAGAPQGLTPGEGAQRVPTIDNNLYMPDGKTPNPNYGQAITVPLSTVTPGAAPPAAPRAPQAPPSPTNQPRLAPPTAPTAAATPGTLPTAVPPGADIPIKSANEAWAAASGNANTYARRIFPVAQAIDIAKSGDVTTGQGAQAINDLKSWLQTRASLFGWNAQTIANSKFQELDKYLHDNINQMPMASQSDARLASAYSGMPNTHLNDLSLLDTLKATQALMRMEQMAAIDFAARGAPNGQFNNFLRDWQTTHDPRAFAFDQMTDAQRTKMVTSMKPGERAAFGRTLDLIEKHPEILNTAAMPH